MATNIKIVERVVTELPEERPLVTGEKYKVMQSDGTLIEYTIDSQGEPVRVKGITNDESSRLDRLSSDQISKVESITTGDISKLKDLDSQDEIEFKLSSKVDKESGKSLVKDGLIEKLEEDYTKAEIDQQFNDVRNLANSSRINLNGSIVLPVPPRRPDNSVIEDAWVELSQNVTYTQSGGNPITGIEGHRSIAEWDNDNQVWNLVDMGELPTVTGTDVLNPIGEGVPKEKAVADYALEKYSKRALPEGFEYIDVDRPDLQTSTEIILVDKNFRYIPSEVVEKTDTIEFPTEKVTTEKAVLDYALEKYSNRSLPIGYEYIDIDRPDLQYESGIIIVDKNFKYIPSEDESAPLIYVSEAVGGINLQDEWFNVENVLSSYDSLVEWTASKYNIKKTVAGKSSTEDRDIPMYSFYPTSYKQRVLITTATHGSEKTSVYAVYKLAEQLAKKSDVEESIKYIRENVRVDIIPVMSPTSTIRDDGALGNSRRTRETSPIPITWSKSGNQVTISFEESDFPTSNPRVNASDYFSNPNIVGKTYVSVFNSSNDSVLGEGGYIIESIVNARSVVLTTPTSGSGSGTAEIVVSVDPNRNANIVWDEFVSVGANAKYPGDYAPSVHTNKGTKPVSLNEMYILQNLLSSNNYTYYLDAHSGSGDNYLTWSGKAINISEMTALAKSTQEKYSNKPFNIYRLDNLTNPTMTNWYGQVMNKEGLTYEWSQPNNSVTPAFQLSDRAATDATRWVSIIFSTFLKTKYQ